MFYENENVILIFPFISSPTGGVGRRNVGRRDLDQQVGVGLHLGQHLLPVPELVLPVHAQTREHTNAYALLLWIQDSMCQTGAMATFRSTPSTHPRSRRSSPPPPSPLHLDSNQAGGGRHGGRTPPQ